MNTSSSYVVESTFLIAIGWHDYHGTTVWEKDTPTHYDIDSFMAIVWRNVRSQYQFKTAEVTSKLDAAMFLGGTDLYSVHWVHEANHHLPSSRCYSDFTIAHLEDHRFCEANQNMVLGSPARTDITQWSLYKSISHHKNMAAFDFDITSAILDCEHWVMSVLAGLPRTIFWLASQNRWWWAMVKSE